MIRAVCFDFDGTLARFTGEFDRLIDLLRTDLMLLNCDLGTFGERLSAELRRDGPVTLRSALVATLESLEQRVPADLDEVAERALGLYAAEIEVLPGAEELLTELYRERIPMALLTNGPEDMQRAALRRAGLERFFRAVLISGDRDVAVRKPHPRIFDLALTGLESLPEETLMVGDNLEADVNGALAQGLRAVHIGAGADGVPGLSGPAELRAYLRSALAETPG